MANNIVRIRKEKGYTETAFAEKIGISRSTLVRYEKGDVKRPNYEILKLIARELEMTIDELGVEE